MACCQKRKRPWTPPWRTDIKWEHLVVTDISWAGGPTFCPGPTNAFGELERRGAVLQEKVNAFDFMHCLAQADNPDISQHALNHGFDIIVMCGLCFGTFNPDGSLNVETNVAGEQYGQISRLGKHSQTAVFHEAVLGQDPYATIVNIHAENHQRYFLSAASNAYLRLGLFNPSRMRMVMGRHHRPTNTPLVCTTTSQSLREMKQFITVNQSSEEQLDINRLLIDTLASGGHVLVLGAGRLDLCNDLMEASDSERYAASESNGLHRVTSLERPGRRAKHINGTMVTYMNHCHDQHNDERKVIFEKVMDWVLSEHSSWNATATCRGEDEDTDTETKTPESEAKRREVALDDFPREALSRCK